MLSSFSAAEAASGSTITCPPVSDFICSVSTSTTSLLPVMKGGSPRWSGRPSARPKAPSAQAEREAEGPVRERLLFKPLRRGEDERHLRQVNAERRGELRSYYFEAAYREARAEVEDRRDAELLAYGAELRPSELRRFRLHEPAVLKPAGGAARGKDDDVALDELLRQLDGQHVVSAEGEVRASDDARDALYFARGDEVDERLPVSAEEFFERMSGFQFPPRNFLSDVSETPVRVSLLPCSGMRRSSTLPRRLL